MCDTDSLALFGLDDAITQYNVQDMLDESSDVKDVLNLLVRWMAQEYFLDCDTRIFNTATDFVDVSSYNNPSANKTGSVFMATLLDKLDEETVPAVQTVRQNWTTFTSKNLFNFPTLTKVNTDSVTLALRLPVAPDDIEDRSQQWLSNFYGDSQWGAYALTTNDSSKILSDPLYIEGSFTSNAQYDVNIDLSDTETATFLYGYTLNMKLSFLPSLYQLIAESTKTGDTSNYAMLYLLSREEFDNVRVDESVPFPSLGHTLQEDFCRSETDCDCLYFVVFRSLRGSNDMPLSTPAHNLYVNRYQEPNCLCYVSRAVRLGESQILNPFAMCFDQNCLDPTVDRSGFDLDCQDQCDVAQTSMSSVNWQDNFLNPGVINVNQVENVCNMSITPISSDNDRWRPIPILFVGGAALTLSVPIYVLVSSLQQKYYRFSFWHLILFLITSGIGGVAIYALSGKYKCLANTEQLDRQAFCFDRLTHSVPLSMECCDLNDPLFCQCDAANFNQRVCNSEVTSSFCKCQSNGLCIPSSGDSGIIRPSSNESINWNAQYIFLTLALFLFITPLLTVALVPFFKTTNIQGDLIQSIYTILTVVASFMLIVVIPGVLLYTLVPERSFVVDVNAQNKVCSVSSE